MWRKRTREHDSFGSDSKEERWKKSVIWIIYKANKPKHTKNKPFIELKK